MQKTLVLLALMAAPLGAQSNDARLLAVDSVWAKNYATHDTANARRLMADDFFMTSTNGGTKDRETELGDVRSAPGMTLHYFRTEQVRARAYDNAGVVTGVAAWSFTMGANTSTIKRRYTATYVKGGPLGWRLVALHMGRAE